MSTIKTNWNFKELYKSELAWSRDFETAENLYARLRRSDKNIQETAKILKLLLLEDNLKSRLRRLQTYAFLKSELHIKSATARDNLNRTVKLESLVDIELSLVHNLINKMPMSKLKYIQGLKKTRPVKSLLASIIKEKRYKGVSNKEKKLMQLYSQQFNAYEEIHREIQVNNINFNRITTQGKMVKLNHSNVVNYCKSWNRDIRQKANIQRQKAYDKNKDSIAAVLKGHINGQVIQSRVEGAEDTVENILSVEGLDREYFEKMIKENLKHKPTIKKYYEYYKTQLKVRSLYFYDLHAETKKKSNKKFSVQEAKDIISRATNNFSDEFKQTLEKAFTDNWIQIVSQGNKSSFMDGFSFNPTVTHPFILTTFDGSASDVLTLAHEVGHGVHGAIGNKKKPFYDELNLASTQELFAFTNELLTANEIKNSCTTPTMKREFLNTLLQYFLHNVYDRSQKVDMEIQLYDMVNNDQKFTSSILNQKTKHLNKKYYESIVNLRGNIGVDWAFSDYYFSNFYAAEYLVAFCLATYCVDRILSNDKEFIQRYEKAMTMTGSAYLSKICKMLEPDLDIYDPKFLVSFTYKKMQELIEENSQLNSQL